MGPPNTRVQRTRSSPSALRSPLTRHPLGGRGAAAAILSAAVFGSVAPNGARGDLSLKLECPVSVHVGQHLKLRLTARNTGPRQFYFEEPWWWGEGGLHVVATSADGTTVESTPMLYDIESRLICNQFKALSPGNSFSFDAWLVIGVQPVVPTPPPWPSTDLVEEATLPHIALRPGRYRLSWVYEPKLTEGDKDSAVAGVSIWVGQTRSADIDVRVQ